MLAKEVAKYLLKQMQATNQTGSMFQKHLALSQTTAHKLSENELFQFNKKADS